MNDQTDSQLLRAYAEHRAEPAFAELVRRHVDFVYSAALRMVCDSHLAEDVTQAVFVALAKNATQLMDRPVLSGWLHRTAQNIAAQTVRTDVRRRAREQEAVVMNELIAGEPEAGWERIAPYLDAALGELSEADRDALLLRYFERKSAQEMAQILGLSNEAAQKRVSRAVERLREFFSKRNVTIGAGGLAVLISANAVQAAPVGLAVAISAATVLAGTAVSTSTVITATKAIAMTTLQKILVATTVAVLAGAGVYEARQAAQLRQQNQTLLQQQTPLAEQLQQLQQERDEATNQLAGLLAENSRLISSPERAELLKLRGEVAQLKNAASDSTADAAKNWLTRVNQLKQWAEQNPAAEIPEFKLLTKQDWLNAARSDLNTDADYRRAISSLRDAAENKVASMMQSALGKYIQANGGQFPSDLSQLQSYFDSPLDDAILQRWEIVPGKTIPNIGVGEPDVITEKFAVDDLLDTRMVIGARGNGSTDFLQTEIGNTVNPLRKAYGQAHGGDWSGFNNSNLLEYATTPEQQAAVQKLIKQQQLRSGQ